MSPPGAFALLAVADDYVEGQSVEKLIYPLWHGGAPDADEFRDRLLAGAGQMTGLPGVRGMRLAVADSAVADGAQRRMAASRPLPDAMLSVWLDAATQHRGELEAQLESMVDRYSCYLVTESEPIVNTEHPEQVGERVYGMCHVVFLQRPPRLSPQEWLAIWQDSHTPVAIDTQSTFGYRQNVIVRRSCTP